MGNTAATGSDRPSTHRFLAVVSLGAAAIHFAVGPDHFAELVLYGVLFTALAWFQALTALVLVAGGARLRAVAAVAAVVNLGAIGVWIVSRTAGLPFGDQPWTPEVVGTADVIASVLEAILVVGLAYLALPSARGDRPGREAAWAPIAMAATSAAVILATAYAVASLAPAPMPM